MCEVMNQTEHHTQLMDAQQSKKTMMTFGLDSSRNTSYGILKQTYLSDSLATKHLKAVLLLCRCKESHTVEIALKTT